ncbi:MAG TPA: M56 family metallopeptidase [Gemmatimonadaceae bacterium]|nr:M56 family metallopeptidase [Gemmatimonadaceae bacterium]
MIALWMTYAIVVAAVVGAAAAILERTTAGTVQGRRWLWLGALIASSVIPAWAAFGWTATQPVEPQASSATARDQRALVGVASEIGDRIAKLMTRADARALGRYDSSLAFAWIGAALLALAAFGAASWTLAARRRRWRMATIDGQDVLLSPAVGPAVIGTIRPQIVVPEWALALTPEQRALMLEHERQHIHSRDPLLLHVAALLTLAMPWNVAAWWITRRLRVAVELDCDARVLASGRDAREYGTLLLDVCSRRVRGGPLLAPALFERTSSLTRRILAMHPARARYPRVRLALGTAMALAAVVVACEMPSPEMLAPDGKDAASTRVYGNGTASGALAADELRQIVAERFPEVARGEGGPRILFVVKSADGKVVLSESQAADSLGLKQSPTRRNIELRGGAEATNHEPGRVRATAGTGEIRLRKTPSDSQSVGTLRVRTRASGGSPEIPSGVAALRPNDIEAIEVSKHAAGRVAPQPVSVILISLKSGAAVPR